MDCGVEKRRLLAVNLPILNKKQHLIVSTTFEFPKLLHQVSNTASLNHGFQYLLYARHVNKDT